MSARHAAPDDPEAVPDEQAAYRELVKRRRSFYRLWLLMFGGIDIGVGVAYLTGPAASPNLQLVAELAPIQVWAGAFCVVGLLMVVGYQRGGRWVAAAGFAGSAVWIVWFGAVVLTITVVSSGIGLPVYLGFAVVHATVVYGARSGLIPTDRRPGN